MSSALIVDFVFVGAAVCCGGVCVCKCVSEEIACALCLSQPVTSIRDVINESCDFFFFLLNT